MVINKYNRRIIQALISFLSPIKVRHLELSLLLSVDDSKVLTSKRLINLMSEVLENIYEVFLDEIKNRTEASKKYSNVWPGEHYRLLSSITKALKPKMVVEIGTATGLSALAIKKYLPTDAKIATFDVIKWQDYPDKCLKKEDFIDGRLKQYIADLSKKSVALKYAELLQKADLIFVDAEKDGIMEEKFLEHLKLIKFKKDPIIIFDDIHLWNMLKIWHDVSMPKLDITSFGHWSGTGLIDWKSNF